ncbi:MAG: hypothetical protein AAGF57_14510 [Pseudomonadota bacterium]
MAMDASNSDTARPSKMIVVTLDAAEIRGLLAIAGQIQYSGAFGNMPSAQRDAARRGMAAVKTQLLLHRSQEPVAHVVDIPVLLKNADLKGVASVTRHLTLSDFDFLGNDESESADMMASIDELKSALKSAVWLN